MKEGPDIDLLASLIGDPARASKAGIVISLCPIAMSRVCLKVWLYLLKKKAFST